MPKNYTVTIVPKDRHVIATYAVEKLEDVDMSYEFILVNATDGTKHFINKAETLKVIIAKGGTKYTD